MYSHSTYSLNLSPVLVATFLNSPRSLASQKPDGMIGIQFTKRLPISCAADRSLDERQFSALRSQTTSRIPQNARNFAALEAIVYNCGSR